jgi:hypothetical protein
MKPCFKALLGSVFAGALIAGGTASADVVLPTPNCGLSGNCLAFDDFTVYSLALLNFQTGNGTLHPNDPYYVKSTGSDIANDIVIGSSDANAINNQDIASIAGKVDNAYNTPNNPNSPVMGNFLMIPSKEPIATGFVGDNAAQSQTTIVNPNTAGIDGASGPVNNGTLPLWDIQTQALQTYLAGSKLVFYFNLNQINSNSTYLTSGQDMLGYLDVYLTNTVTGARVKFTLSGDDCGTGPGSCTAAQSFAASDANQNNILPTTPDPNDPDGDVTHTWAYIHGQICVADDGTVLGFGTCASLGVTGNTVNQNLGANNAAFALYSQGLQDALDSGLYNVMSVDLRMAAEDNGFEQLFIAATTIPGVPEASSLVIVIAGLTFLAFGRQRRRKDLGQLRLG